MRTIKSIRLPRKLKKDVIKVCGRELLQDDVYDAPTLHKDRRVLH